MPQYSWRKDRLPLATITDALGLELTNVLACDTETGYVRREQLWGDGVITFGEMRPAPLTVQFYEPLNKPPGNPMTTKPDRNGDIVDPNGASSEQPELLHDHKCLTEVQHLPLGAKVEWFVNRVFGGVHHCYKVEDKGIYFLVIPNNNHSFATFDGDKLTKIVMMAHRLCLRAEVTNHGMRGLKILLHNRKREDVLCRRHPDVEDMVAKYPPLTIKNEE